MAAKLPDLGRYTEDETVEIAIDALNNLTLEKRIEVVRAAFDRDERDELAEHLAANK